jgi:hypothetical protein
LALAVALGRDLRSTCKALLDDIDGSETSTEEYLSRDYPTFPGLHAGALLKGVKDHLDDEVTRNATKVYLFSWPLKCAALARTYSEAGDEDCREHTITSDWVKATRMTEGELDPVTRVSDNDHLHAGHPVKLTLKTVLTWHGMQ